MMELSFSQDRSSSFHQLGMNNRRQLFLLQDETISNRNLAGIENDLQTPSIAELRHASTTQLQQQKLNPEKRKLELKFSEEHQLDIIAGKNSCEEKVNYESQNSQLRKQNYRHSSYFLRNNDGGNNKDEFRQNKSKNYLKVFFLIQKFIQKIKMIYRFRNINFLTKKHFLLINDYAYDHLPQIQQTRLRKLSQAEVLLNRLANFLFHFFIKAKLGKRIKVFEPNELFIMFFQLIVFILLISQIIFIPFKQSFRIELDADSCSYLLLYSVPIVALIIEILINANQGFYEEGSTIKDRKLIIINLIKTSLPWQIIAIFSLTYCSYNQSSIISMLFLVRLPYFIRLTSILDDNFQFWQKIPTEFTLLKLLLFIIIVAHFCACGFNLIGLFQIDYFLEDGTWLHKYQLIQSEPSVVYLNALYYSFITMITVGYGDISPQTNIEKIYVIIMTLVACGIFAYAVNTIGQIFQEIAKKTDQYKQNKQQVYQYMKNRNISSQTQIRVLKYIEYLFQREGELNQQGEKFIQQLLPKRLREEVQQEYFGAILKKFKLFKLIFSKQFLMSLASSMHEMTLGPEEILFNQGEVDLRLFFIQKGEIEIYFKTIMEGIEEDRVLGSLQNDKYFGQTGFITNKPREYSVRSKNISSLIYLTQEDFISILKLYPVDYEKFCMLRDQILFENRSISNTCFSCQSYGHTINNCPQLHFVVEKEVHNKRLARLIINPERVLMQRKQTKKIWNTLANRAQLVRLTRLKRLSLIEQYADISDLHSDTIDIKSLESDKAFFKRYQAFHIDFSKFDKDSSSSNQYNLQQNRQVSSLLDIQESEQSSESDEQTSNCLSPSFSSKQSSLLTPQQYNEQSQTPLTKGSKKHQSPAETQSLGQINNSQLQASKEDENSFSPPKLTQLNIQTQKTNESKSLAFIANLESPIDTKRSSFVEQRAQILNNQITLLQQPSVQQQTLNQRRLSALQNERKSIRVDQLQNIQICNNNIMQLATQARVNNQEQNTYSEKGPVGKPQDFYIYDMNAIKDFSYYNSQNNIQNILKQQKKLRKKLSMKMKSKNELPNDNKSQFYKKAKNQNKNSLKSSNHLVN